MNRKSDRYLELAGQLRDLALDRKSFFTEDGDDEIFRAGYAACVESANILERLAKRKERRWP